jgi:hypothetical protein
MIWFMSVHEWWIYYTPAWKVLLSLIDDNGVGGVAGLAAACAYHPVNHSV